MRNKKIYVISWVALFFLTMCWFLLNYNMPIYPRPSAMADDGMLFAWAKSISAGSWLGQYDWKMHTKGPVFSIVLALSNRIGLSYLVLELIIYWIGCVLFSYSLKNYMKSTLSLYLIYAVMLINPIATATYTYQKVYRNGLILGLELIVFSFYVYLFNDASIRKAFILSIFAALSYACMIYMREDSIWIMCFMIVATIIIIIYELISQGNPKRIFAVCVMLLIPFICAWGIGITIKHINRTHYGISVVTDTKNSYFAKTYGLIISIADPSIYDYQRVNVTREKLDRLYEVSPTLNNIKGLLNNQYYAWSMLNRDQSNHELEGTLFFWAFRDAVGKSGYYESGKESEVFYRMVYEELNLAIENGELTLLHSMPSILMQPWRAEYGKLLSEQFIQTAKFVSSFEKVSAMGIDLPNVNETDEAKMEMAAYCHTNVILDNPQLNDEHYIKNISFKISIKNGITLLFRLINPVFLAFSVAFTLVYFIVAIYRLAVRKDYAFFRTPIIMMGIFLSFVLILLGVSYIEISDYEAINYMYLSPAYPLMIGGEVIATIKTFEVIHYLARNHGINNTHAVPK